MNGTSPLSLSNSTQCVKKTSKGVEQTHERKIMICIIKDCGKEMDGRGYCNMHYKRFMKHGDPLYVKVKQTPSGLWRTPEYNSWESMLKRCRNVNHKSYKYYGALGIRVCDRWIESVSNFVEDMGKRPPGTSLDRIDPFGDYKPSNCRWATVTQQNNNQKKHYSRV
jgi:hypothetical protein